VSSLKAPSLVMGKHQRPVYVETKLYISWAVVEGVDSFLVCVHCIPRFIQFGPTRDRETATPSWTLELFQAFFCVNKIFKVNITIDVCDIGESYL